MSKNVLFLVTGGTPQIITETLWALACNPDIENHWIPDEIHVMSTLYGLNEVRNKLLGKDKILEQMKAEYKVLGQTALKGEFLYCFKDNRGKNLNDLRTPEENEYAANAICDKVREFTQDNNVNLHVSIAGGRKTMGFYAGYALSLYGRAQDRMSHVLVDEKYEKGVNFFYPSSTNDDFIVDRDHKTIGLSKDAKVWLADIPFVRLRTSLPDSSLIKNSSFSDVVDSINLANKPICLQLHVKKKTMTISNKSVKLAPREFAFYRWFAERAIDQEESFSAIVEGEHRPIPRLFELWKGQDNLDPTDPLSGKFDKPFFEQRLAKIKSIFNENFGENVARLVLVRHKDGRGSGYILPLQPWQIEIIE